MFVIHAVLTFLELIDEVVGDFLKLGTVNGKKAFKVLDLLAEILGKGIEGSWRHG